MYHLGVDLGTTSVKCCIQKADDISSSPVHLKQVHNADDISRDHSNRHEQSPQLILTAVRMALSELASKIGADRLEVAAVSVCCQMHGIMFWNDEHDTSNLITWQDGRCSDQFISEIRGFSECGDDLHPGYGCATLAWFARYSSQELGKYQFCGTVADYFVFVLCGLQESVISDHNAQSWGFFNDQTRSWDSTALIEAHVRIIMPRIVESGSEIGTVINKGFHIKEGARVYIPIGDLQASVFSVLGGAAGRVFNYGTASQIVHTVPTDDFSPLHPSIRRCLYTNNHSLITAASLNGGNALEVVFKLFSSLSEDKKLDYETVMKLAYEKRDTNLVVSPVFFGERHDTGTFGSFRNVTSENFTVGDISAAVLRGVVQNLCDMMQGVGDGSKETLYAVGIAERDVLQYFVKQCLGEFEVFEKEVTAAYGAILFDQGYRSYYFKFQS